MRHALLPSDEALDSSIRERAQEAASTASTEASSPPNAVLVEMIERYIIPRMMVAHSVAPSVGECEPVPPPTELEIESFADVAVRDDVTAALLVVEAAGRRGLTLEALLLDLIAPTARLLGRDWESDVRSFAEVTVGIGTLQQVVNVLASRFSAPPFERGQVLLTAHEDEQHTLGLNILAELLRRAGWVVDLRTSWATKELLEYVATEKLEAVGFTVSNERLLPSLAGLVAAVRRRACNPRMPVFVGGPLPLEDFAARCGAICPGDAPSTVRWLERNE